MDQDARLSRIETLWSIVRQAHGDDASQAQSAQQALLETYGGAVRRYLLGALRDEEAADEVFQEFALKFVRGDFQNADPQRGRFRKFVKSAIYHLIVDFQRRATKQNKLQHLVFDHPEDVNQSLQQMDSDFTASWRTELLARTWTALEQAESSSGKPYYTVLKFRADHPNMRSPELAQELSSKLDRPINAGNVRVLVHRAREQFSDLLVAKVEASMEGPSLDELEDELISLDLLAYCKPSITRRHEVDGN